MAEAVKNADVDLVCWADGVESKILGKGKEWGKEEFDKLTGHCDVCRSCSSGGFGLEEKLTVRISRLFWMCHVFCLWRS